MGHTKELTHISLCAGYGGIDIGLSRAIRSVRTVCFVEIESFCIENLVAKIEGGWLDPAPVFSNLKTFPWRKFAGRVDILSGGFPCQPFSAAGRKAGDEDPRHLWPHIVRGIREMERPPIVFFENVEGIISSKLKSDGWSDPKGTSVLHHVLRELERLGYQATAGVFSAREVGAPHQRKRVFIMGCRSDLGQSERELVSSMLRRTDAERNVEYSRSERLQGSGLEQGSKRLQPELTQSSGVVYPAPRGAEQYSWEPPRVTVGNTKHNGSPSAEKQRSSDTTSDDCTQRTDSPLKLEGASQSRSNGDIQTGIAMGNPPSEGLQGGEQESCRARPNIRSITAYADGGEQNVVDTDDPRLQGHVPSVDTGRPQPTNSESTTRPSARRVVQRSIEPPMGGSPDGIACGMGYAELCESMDNYTDELRLLGNGVVPQCAEKAFKHLWRSLNGD